MPTADRECVVVLRHTTGRQPKAQVSGRVSGGESLSAGARRLARDATGVADAEPWPLDLSVESAAFVCDVPETTDLRSSEPIDPALRARAERFPQATIGFRPLTRADFPDVVAWQQQPHVSRWWQGEATDVAAAEDHYGQALDGHDPTRMWVLEVNGRSLGLLQDYRVGDHPDYSLLTAKPDAVAFDYLVGDPAWVGRGIGTRMLWAYLRDVVHPGYPQARELFAAPDHRNEPSLRVLDKLGFVRGLWFDEPQGDGRVDTVVGCTLDVDAVLA